MEVIGRLAHTLADRMEIAPPGSSGVCDCECSVGIKKNKKLFDRKLSTEGAEIDTSGNEASG